MGMSKAERIAALLGNLKKENKFEQIANVIDKVSIKESDQIREIVPIEEAYKKREADIARQQ